MITRKSLADEIDVYDQSIADLNTGKKDCFDAYRDQLIAAGVSKPNVKAEIEAVKLAIRKRRVVAADANAFEEKCALVDEIFDEITATARAPRATRVENIEQFDAETGEITNPIGKASVSVDPSADHVSPPAPQAAMGSGSANIGGSHEAVIVNANTDQRLPASGETSLAAREGEKPLHSISILSAEPSQAATEQADESAPPASSASDIPEDVPAFILKDRKPLRPYCQHPDDLTQCGGYGQKHCGPCRKAMADREAA